MSQQINDFNLISGTNTKNSIDNICEKQQVQNIPNRTSSSVTKSALLIAMSMLLGMSLSSCIGNQAAVTGDIEDEAPFVTAEAEATDDQFIQGVSPSFKPIPQEVLDEREADGLLQRRLIFFDYDKSTISNEQIDIIVAHAEFLVRNPDLSIILEGHTDERGSDEYNIALGQQRADTVREILVSQGVLPSQVETISYGEERPRTLGNSESAWADNRRAEIRYFDE